MQKYQRIPETAECPVCGAGAALRLWSTTSSQAAQNFVLREKHPDRFLELASHIECLWGQSVCHVVQCERCGFCYSSPYVAGDERFYDLAYDRRGYPKWKWEFQRTYDALKERCRPDQSLLEIGAGDGAFVARIADDILPKENIVCTEFSKYGRDEIEKLGVKCLSEDVRDLPGAQWEDSFDVVCLFQVLEHMDRLKVLFQKLTRMMKSSGSLFIAVPNPKRIEFNELNGALLDMPPNHIGRWNRRCFEEVGAQNGLRIEGYRVEEESRASIARQFVVYRYLRKSQEGRSLENRIERIGNRYLLGAMRMIGVALGSVGAVPALVKSPPGIGDSQWVHLIKGCSIP